MRHLSNGGVRASAVSAARRVTGSRPGVGIRRHSAYDIYSLGQLLLLVTLLLFGLKQCRLLHIWSLGVDLLQLPLVHVIRCTHGRVILQKHGLDMGVQVGKEHMCVDDL